MSNSSHVNQPGPENLWTPDDVAAYLRCSKRHVANLCTTGLPHFFIGRLQRFRRVDVERFLSQNPRLSLRRLRRVNSAPTEAQTGKGPRQ